ncbi:hypothetical protein MTO96_018658 [Rhipicephalus appendiculatus]
MSGHLGNLSAHQQEALDQFRQVVGDVKKPEHTDAFLLRWLRAELTPAVVHRHCIYLLEYMESLKHSSKREAGEELENQYLVIDLDKFGLRQVYSWQTIKAITDMLRMMEDHFPECLEKCICINAPSFFPVLWKLVRPFMTQRTADKVNVYGKDGWKSTLLDIMDADQLPVHWGGNMVGPGNDSRCRHKVNHGGRFEEVAPPSVFKEEGVQLKNIGRRDRWELPVSVSEPGVQISWRFQTASGDLSFGVRTESGETLVPLRRFESSSHEPQEGCWQCDTPGTYILEFDNSFSWLNGKKLAYVVNTHAVNEDS